MSLYNIYRPSTFEEVVGNTELVEFLQNQVKDPDTCTQVMLFHGPTGCGKTTLARIVSKELGCSELDFKEIDTADFRGIDTVRGIIRSSKFKSFAGSVRVWLIDEVHKATNEAQNALLKLLEDTPKGAFFILCTTDPNKLLKTVRGRCIELQVSPLSDKMMKGLLKRVVKNEGEYLHKKVYTQIVQDAVGLPRNALQILEKVLSVEDKSRLKMAEQSAIEVNVSIELCRALISKNGWTKVKRILSGLKDQDAESIRRHVLAYAQSVLLRGENDDAALVIQEFWEPLYNIGFPGLVYACYSVCKG